MKAKDYKGKKKVEIWGPPGKAAVEPKKVEPRRPKKKLLEW